MNNVVCYVCGTKYSEEETQCPLCGYSKEESVRASSKASGTYTYVKGGRFSAENVQKRNGAVPETANKAVVNTAVKTKTAPAENTAIKASKKEASEDSGKKSSAAPVIIAVVLFLAILAVLAYIALRFFIPNNAIYEGFGGIGLPQSNQQMEEAEDAIQDNELEEAPVVSLDCTAVKLNATTVTLTEMINCMQLSATLTPENTPDAVSYTSSDDTIATVDETGLVTAVGKGTAVITVTCGNASAECTVISEVEEKVIELTLNRKEITFDTEGQSWLLYDGEIPMNEILWTTDDETIASIAEGKVVAVAIGDTTVYATYGEQTVACQIHCKFDENADNGGAVTEAEGSASKAYKLYNPYGYAEDVLISAGEKFTLKLVDEDLVEVTDAQWSVNNQSVCTFANNTVTGVGSGTTEVIATYNGNTYTCIVRVK